MNDKSKGGGQPLPLTPPRKPTDDGVRQDSIPGRNLPLPRPQPTTVSTTLPPPPQPKNRRKRIERIAINDG